MHRHEPALTQDQLQRGLDRLLDRRRQAWPRDLQQALADPTVAPLVRGMARCLARQQPRAPAATKTPRRWRGPTFDARRAAANDLDD